MVLTKKTGEGALINDEVLITIADIKNNCAVLDITHNKNKELFCKSHATENGISVISDSLKHTTTATIPSKEAIEKNANNNKLLQQVDNSLDHLVEIGLKALDSQQFDLAEQLFLQAKDQGYKSANRYLSVIKKRKNNEIQ